MRITVGLEGGDTVGSFIAEACAPDAEALKKTADAVLADAISRQIFPFRQGNLQNNDTFVRGGENFADIITANPYARRLYYHPEYNFQRGKNANAGGRWWESLSAEWVATTYAHLQ